MPLIPMTTLDDARLTVFRDVKAIRHSKWAGRFVAEGKRLVKRLLLSDYEVESVLLDAGQVDHFLPWLSPETPAFVMPQSLAAELVGYNFHCGAMACAFRKPSPTLADLMSQGQEQTTLIVCPDVNDPENIGTLIRLGAAFEVDGLLLGPACADPFSRRVLRVSMGNALTLPISVTRDLKSDLLRLKSDWQVELIAAVVEDSDPTDGELPPLLFNAVETEVTSPPRTPATPLHTVQRPRRMALLFGNEAHGLGDDVLEVCDRRVTIPMHGADSLNVAVAAGIFLYHFTAASTPRSPDFRSLSDIGTLG